MFKIGTHICDELKNSPIKIKKLGLNEQKEVLDSVLKKYTDINKKGAWIWEKFIHYKALNDDMARQDSEERGKMLKNRGFEGMREIFHLETTFFGFCGGKSGKISVGDGENHCLRMMIFLLM